MFPCKLSQDSMDTVEPSDGMDPHRDYANRILLSKDVIIVPCPPPANRGVYHLGVTRISDGIL